MSRAMMLFSTAALLPVPLIALGALMGGGWVLAALLYITVFTALVDRLITVIPPLAPDSEFPVADRLSVTLALGHFGVLLLALRALSAADLGLWEKLALFIAAGQFMGQVSNANAHELIHRSARGLHRLGVWVYVSMLYGHHASAHPLIHHRHVATDADPNSAPKGMSYYHFAPRAWIGAFRKGLAVETARMRRAGRDWWRHPYVTYVGGAALMLVAAYGIFGGSGLLWYLALAGYATAQLILSDYVQHYGLRRAIGPDGRPEPVGPAHSWDSPHVWSSAILLNAPRHSDHHSHPARPYPWLRLDARAHVLPRSLPVMATVALSPTLWRRMMDRRI